MDTVLIEDGKVTQKWVGTTKADIHSHAVESLVETDQRVFPGMLYDGSTFTSLARVITAEHVADERTRRLELGYDYDFGDERGIHHIGTTAADMAGWREVTDFANGLINLGDTTTTIAVVTDTGPCAVTAPEWQAIILHAGSLRQAIWAKSFALQAMDPIPSDYADDNYWT